MILVSACLVGERCRYDGGAYAYPDLVALVAAGEALPVCPEQLGGLPTPRPPAEIQPGDGETVIACRDGTDVTAAFLRGAEATAERARACGATMAVLKSRSPSCGCDGVYDGSFSGRLRPGQGVTAARLEKMGLVLTDETRYPTVLAAHPPRS